MVHALEKIVELGFDEDARNGTGIITYRNHGQKEKVPMSRRGQRLTEGISSQGRGDPIDIRLHLRYPRFSWHGEKRVWGSSWWLGGLSRARSEYAGSLHL